MRTRLLAPAGASSSAHLAVAGRQLAELLRYPQPQRTRYHLGGQRRALSDRVAVELKLITLLHRDRDLASREPIELIIGLPAPGQDPGRQPDPVAERTRRGDEHIQLPVVGTGIWNQLNVGHQEADIADDDDTRPAPERWLIIDRDGGVQRRDDWRSVPPRRSKQPSRQPSSSSHRRLP